MSQEGRSADGAGTAAPLVRTQVTGGVATITMDSPDNANALSTGLLTLLRAQIEQALADEHARVLVLTGAGRVFCSGADLKEARTSPAGAVTLMAGVFDTLWNSSKPVIARVNGAARAGGLGLIAACDIAIAAERASFAFTEVRIGVAPALISVLCLRRMTPRAAAEYFLTGEVFGAARAAEVGLVTASVPDADLDAQTARYAGMLLRGAPGALAATRAVLREGTAEPVSDGFARMAELSGTLFAGEEAREGREAFAAKRDPSWARLNPPGAGTGLGGG